MVVAFNDDVILTVLACCDISTVAKCRAISKRFKRIIDKELALEMADFSTLTFRQRRGITDSAMTLDFVHMFRRASIVYLDGTGIGHFGASKLITEYTKELHVERCPRVDIGKLIQAIAGQRWLSYDLDPIRLYTKNRETQGIYDYHNILKPLYENSWAVIMMSNNCPCRYVEIEEYQDTNAILCHVCDKDVKNRTKNDTCTLCGNVVCKECQIRLCSTSSCDSVHCKGCTTEARCSLCHREWCILCSVWVFQCYGCEANVCGECQPSHLKCSVEEFRQYCAQCAGAMADQGYHWCCDTGRFIIEPTC